MGPEASNLPPQRAQLRGVKVIDLYHALTFAFEQGWVPRGWVRWDRVEALKRSIEERGLIEPIVCAMLPDGRLVPVHGVHRIMALMKLGPPTREVPVVVRPVGSVREVIEVAIEAGVTTELSREELFAVLASHDYPLDDLGRLMVDGEVVDVIKGLNRDLREWLAKAVVRRGLDREGGVVIPFRKVAEVAELSIDLQARVFKRVVEEVPDPSRAEPSKVRRAFEGAIKALEAASGGRATTGGASTGGAATSGLYEDVERVVRVAFDLIDYYYDEAGEWAERALRGVDDERLKGELEHLQDDVHWYRVEAAYWHSRYLEAEERARRLEEALSSGVREEVGRLLDELAELKAALRAQSETLERLRAENARLKEGLRGAGRDLERALVDLMSRAEALEREVERLRRECEELMRENERLRRENAELKARLGVERSAPMPGV